MAGFLKKLTGSEMDDDQDFDENVEYGINDILEDEQEIELSIDLYEDEDNLYLETFIPGVKTKDVDIDVFRNRVVIAGNRAQQKGGDYDYFVQELPWGSFKKQIALPKEVNIDKIKSSNKDGMLTLKLPKMDKDKMVKVSLD